MKQIFIYKAWLMAFLILSQGCRTVADLSGTVPNPKLSSTQIIRAHTQTRPHFEYYAARAQLTYEREGQRQKVNLSLRMKYGDTIWMKASIFGVTLAKGLITKDKVYYYESLKKIYFEAPITEISRWIGIPVSIKQLQDILLGQSAIYMERNTVHNIRNNQYVLGPVYTRVGWRVLNAICPENFRLGRSELSLSGSVPTSVDLKYKDYTTIAEQHFPKQLSLFLKSSDATTAIRLDLKQIDLLDRLNFGFEIPKGFKVIDP